MANSLQSLFGAIAQARDEEELRQHVMVKVGEHFVAERWGLFFFNQLPPVNANLPSIVKLALSIEHNPVLRYVVEQHAPVHEELLLSPGAWKMICPRSDHGHVLAGPIVNNGHLVGGVGFTRVRGTPAFNVRDLADLSALCLHLSTWLTKIQSQSTGYNSPNINRLTSREIQIAELVAQGLTNAEIGAALWITENSVKQALKRMFRKLEVSSRAELVGRLFSNTRLSPSKEHAIY
ncbi:MAG: LuxR family transcriptional regulator [Scytonema sp. CRU_2_7]|nr:LuxR family transcriptional regulator [Scytonema sp. CRU_2_7]